MATKISDTAVNVLKKSGAHNLITELVCPASGCSNRDRLEWTWNVALVDNAHDLYHTMLQCKKCHTVSSLLECTPLPEWQYVVDSISDWFDRMSPNPVLKQLMDEEEATDKTEDVLSPDQKLAKRTHDNLRGVFG